MSLLLIHLLLVCIAVPLLAAVAVRGGPIPEPDLATLLGLADETQANLEEHILDKWFPQAIDRVQGGFHQEFADDWAPQSSPGRLVVHQSRLTWVSAKAALRYPDRRQEWLAISKHGLDFLLDCLWDKEQGGFYWSTDDKLQPDGLKHVYGIAFAIYAAVANFEASGDPRALKLAKDAFLWLDVKAHDDENGGYFEALDRSGQPVFEVDPRHLSSAFPTKPGTDAIGTRMGLKSMNTHIHLLEAFADLSRVADDPLVEQRLREVFEIVRDRIVHPSGFQHMFFHPDWTPASHEDSYGHDIETAYLLLEGAEALHNHENPKTWQIARALVDHTLRVGWDATYGGFYDGGDAETGPISEHDTLKGWWAQAEGLNSLLLLHERYAHETDRYWQFFYQEWSFIKEHQIDQRHGGWYRDIQRDGTPIPGHIKGDAWTEAYHQARSMMNVTDRLRKLANQP